MDHWSPRDLIWGPAPPDNFTGEVSFGPVRADELLNVLVVSFAPSARTDWHFHPGGQVLHATHGVGLVQDDQGSTVILESGDLVHTPPRRVHWHGAMPHSPMVHLSHTTGAETVWVGRKVSEEEYQEAITRIGQYS